MNLDAATVYRWLETQPVSRKPSTIAKYTGIPRGRTDAALRLLEAVDKVKRTEIGTFEAVKS